MPFAKHVHVKRRKLTGAGSLAHRIQIKMRRHLQAVLSLRSALRGRAG